MLNKTKIRQFVKSLAHNQVDFSFKVIQIVITFKKMSSDFLLFAFGSVGECTFSGFSGTDGSGH